MDEIELENKDLFHLILVLEMKSSKSSRTNETCTKQEVTTMLNENSKMNHTDLLNRRRNAMANIWSFQLVRY